ncbi:MAG: SDR family oxidoreductase [Deltaproteobacteria bacterium]|nr:SDR family oxidoreductase [Deltaproteobacteria bacterium]
MEQSLNRFQGKAALVTGAGSGIGRAIALRLAREGADIASVDVNEQGVQETAGMIRELGRAAYSFTCDIASVQDLELTAAGALEKLGKLDILVNNAGTGDSNAFYEDIDEALWDRIYAINVRGPFFFAKAIAKHMIDNGIKGRIINIASTEGKTNRGGSITYASSKSALIALTQALALQFGPFDITVNAICPGLIDTPIWHRSDKIMDLAQGSTIKMVVETAMDSRMIKIARVGMPDDIAGAVAFLASDEASYITSQAINVCGGLEVH